MSLNRVVTEPEGLVYKPDFITTEEERELVSWFETLQFGGLPFANQPSQRKILHYGKGYNWEARKVTPALQPIPQQLLWLRDRCAELAELNKDDIVQALIARYSSGAELGWHTDLEAFGDRVMGVSLGAPCVFQLRKLSGDKELYWSLQAAPRSVYILGGEARRQWQHGVMPIGDMRYSVTFRTINDTDV